ncbi:MAG: Gfo/Idh/MocA family oxidoreductase [Planctomycetota bacterium]|nr:Gfo/Idh/MocA family oxidoreductase [Planctomycetota bacterium]
MKPIRVGIVGYGWVAGAHITSLHEIEGVQVAAVCSRRKLDAKALSAKHGSEIAVYNDYKKMCADKKLDIVSVCTPHPFHPEQVELAAQAGKHLIIEKPIAIDKPGLDRVEAAVKKHKIKACVCFEVRVAGQFQTYHAMLKQGVLGKLHYGEIDYYHGIGPWYGQYEWNKKKAFGGSSLLTAGCHALDALLWLMGSQPVEVCSYSTQSAHPYFKAYDYPTTSSTLIKFKNGAVGKTASVIDCFQPYLFNTHLCGSEGSIWNDKFHTSKFKGLDKSGWSTLHTPLVDSGDVAHHPYTALFKDFIEALRANGKPMFSFEEGLLSHRVCLAADRSAAEGRPVKVKELA